MIFRQSVTVYTHTHSCEDSDRAVRTISNRGGLGRGRDRGREKYAPETTIHLNINI